MYKSKFPQPFLLLAVVAAMCLLQPTLGNAQQDRPSAQQQQPDNQNPPAAMNQPSDPQTFSGKVAKAGGKFVLRDTASNTMYLLDDEGKAKPFEGQEVKVSGTLDAQTKTIHVSSITPGL
jgi:hypothetical protein